MANIYSTPRGAESYKLSLLLSVSREAAETSRHRGLLSLPWLALPGLRGGGVGGQPGSGGALAGEQTTAWLTASSHQRDGMNGDDGDEWRRPAWREEHQK